MLGPARPTSLACSIAAVTLGSCLSAQAGTSGSKPRGRVLPPTPTVALRMEFLGFTVLEDGTGTTGRHSSYHGRTMAEDELYGLPEFLDQRLRYGGRLIPASGSHFDEGVLAYRIDGDDLIVAVAAQVSATEWIERPGNGPVGQGDLFVTVRQGRDVQQFALLNEMNGARSTGNEGRWRAAQKYRYAGEVEIGQAIRLEDEAQVVTSGGHSGHARGENSPEGLDERVFVRDGESTGLGSVRHYDFDAVQPLEGGEMVRWFVTEWTVPLCVFGDEDESMELAFHVSPSCGNDQIGGILPVPSRTERENPPTPRRSPIN